MDFDYTKLSLKKTNVLSRVKAKNWLIDRYPLSGGASFITLGNFNLIYMYSDGLIKSNLLHKHCDFYQLNRRILSVSF